MFVPKKKKKMAQQLSFRTLLGMLLAAGMLLKLLAARHRQMQLRTLRLKFRVVPKRREAEDPSSPGKQAQGALLRVEEDKLWELATKLPGTEERDFTPVSSDNDLFLIVAIHENTREEDAAKRRRTRGIISFLGNKFFISFYKLLTGHVPPRSLCEENPVAGTSVVQGPTTNYGPKLCKMARGGLPVSLVLKHAAIVSDMPREEVQALVEKYQREFTGAATEEKQEEEKKRPQTATGGGGGNGGEGVCGSGSTPLAQIMGPQQEPEFPWIPAKRPRAATIMDVMVAPALRGSGLGKALVRASALTARNIGDFDAVEGAAADHGLVAFYRNMLEGLEDSAEEENGEGGQTATVARGEKARFTGRGVYVPLSTAILDLCRRRLKEKNNQYLVEETLTL